MKTKLTFLLVFYLSFFVSCTKKSDISLAPLFQNSMVLQQQSEVPVWGWAEPYSKVTIHTSWDDKNTFAKADKYGNFLANVSTIGAGGPYEMKISSQNEIVINDILLGEVWLCSGQSNMEMPLKGNLPNDSVNNYKSEIAGANFDRIRLFNVPHNIQVIPQNNINGEWKVCNPDNAQDFSAVAYFFARELNQKLNVPIGLIQSTWGGTPIESWIPAKNLKKIKRFKEVETDLANEENIRNEYENWLKGLDSHYLSDVSYEMLNKNLDSLTTTVYKEINVSDSDWKEHEIPKSFENEFGEIDAVVWYRKGFEFNGDVNKAYELNLGAVDDLDDTYINGVRIGGRTGWQTERIYTIPANLLKKGNNVIAVRVVDLGGGGGIYKGNPRINDGINEIVLLSGNWKYKMLGVFKDWDNLLLCNKDFNVENRPKTKFHYQSPTVLYNGMIAPVIPYKIKGAIWYQGESNVWNPEEYKESFPLLINTWRELWKQGDFPFYYVQIAPYEYDKNNETNKASKLRESQRLAMKVKNTGMVVTSDIGTPNNIHPPNKQDVGKRLVLWALNKDYGFDDLVYSGPIYKSITIEGDKIRVHFENVGSGLYAATDTLTYFEVVENDGIYHQATAKIDNNTVLVSTSKVKSPKHVRFGWTDTAIPNLFNKEGLPAASFCSCSVNDK